MGLPHFLVTEAGNCQHRSSASLAIDLSFCKCCRGAGLNFCVTSPTCFLSRLPAREAGKSYQRSSSAPYRPGGGAARAAGALRSAVLSRRGQVALSPVASAPGRSGQSGAQLRTAPGAPRALPAAGCDWLMVETAAAYWQIRKFRKSRATAAPRSDARAGSALAGDPASARPRTARPPGSSARSYVFSLLLGFLSLSSG